MDFFIFSEVSNPVSIYGYYFALFIRHFAYLHFISFSFLSFVLFFVFCFNVGHIPLSPDFAYLLCLFLCIREVGSIPDLESSGFVYSRSCGALQLSPLWSPEPGAPGCLLCGLHAL